MSDQKPFVREVSGLHRQDKPALPAAMKKLEWLVGTWIIEANYYGEGKVIATRPQENTFSWMYGGMYLLANYRSHGPLAYWEAQQTIYWDAERSLYGGAFFDRFGSVCQTDGQLAGPQEFSYTLSRPFVFMDPGVKLVRAELSRSSDDIYHFELRVDHGAGFQTLIEGSGGRID